MSSDPPGEYPALTFSCRGHEFLIRAVPEGDDIALQITDHYGRILLPLVVKIRGTDLRRGGSFDHRLIDAGMAEFRKAVEALDHTRFREFLSTSRAATDFQWTPAELDAASRIDWSKPAATAIHEGCRFWIDALTSEGRMVFLLRNADGIFDAPMFVPSDSVTRAVMNGTDPVTTGVRAMLAKIRGWSASQTLAFINDTPRLAVRMRASRPSQ